MTILAELFCF